MGKMVILTESYLAVFSFVTMQYWRMNFLSFLPTLTMAFPYSVLLSISYISVNLKVFDCDLFDFGTNVAVFFLADCKTSIACMASIVEASPLDAQ